MPNSKNNRRWNEEKNRSWKLSEKSSSFHGRIHETIADAAQQQQLRRPKTVPDLLMARNLSCNLTPEIRPRLTKLLLNVTIRGSAGAVMVVMSPECSVGDLITAAVKQYIKEGRRPILTTVDSARFDLHYSQFSLESLDPEKKLMELGSRNFYLCPKPPPQIDCDGVAKCNPASPSSPSTCSKEVDQKIKISLPWLKFMDFLF